MADDGPHTEHHAASGGVNDRLTAEARATASALLEWLGSRVDRAAAPGGAGARPAQSPGPCTWCPVCAVVAALRGEQPELTARIAEQASGLMMLLRMMVQAHDGHIPHTHGGTGDADQWDPSDLWADQSWPPTGGVPGGWPAEWDVTPRGAQPDVSEDVPDLGGPGAADAAGAAMRDEAHPGHSDQHRADRDGADRTGADRTGADRTGADRDGTDRDGTSLDRTDDPAGEPVDGPERHGRARPTPRRIPLRSSARPARGSPSRPAGPRTTSPRTATPRPTPSPGTRRGPDDAGRAPATASGPPAATSGSEDGAPRTDPHPSSSDTRPSSSPRPAPRRSPSSPTGPAATPPPADRKPSESSTPGRATRADRPSVQRITIRRPPEPDS